MARKRRSSRRSRKGQSAGGHLLPMTPTSVNRRSLIWNVSPDGDRHPIDISSSSSLYDTIRQCSLTVLSCVEQLSALNSRSSSSSVPALSRLAPTLSTASNMTNIAISDQPGISLGAPDEFRLTEVTAMIDQDGTDTGQDDKGSDLVNNSDIVATQIRPESETQLELAIREFIDTEKSYLHKLRQMNKEFVTRLEAYNDLDGVVPILSSSQIKRIFSNIDEIVKLHTQIYLEIKALRGRPRLDLPFVDVLDRLSNRILDIYAIYAVNYACNQKVVNELINTIPSFASFVAVSERCCNSKMVKLSSLRMEPIQRLSRYIMLLDSIRRYANGVDHPLALLDSVLHKFKDAAEHIDASMKVAQAKQRVIEIQEVFLDNIPDPSLVVNGRYCVRESSLQMLSHKKGWAGGLKHIHKTYSFVLFNDCLIFSSILSDNPRRGRMKGFLDLLYTTVEDHSSDQNDTTFVITSLHDPSKPSLYILAKTVEQKKEWVEDMQICIRQRKELQRQGLDSIITTDTESIRRRSQDVASFSEQQMTATMESESLRSPLHRSPDCQLPDQIELAKRLTRKASARR